MKKSIKDQTTAYCNKIEKWVGEGMTKELGFHDKEDSDKEMNRTEVSDQITGRAVVHTNGEKKGIEVSRENAAEGN